MKKIFVYVLCAIVPFSGPSCQVVEQKGYVATRANLSAALDERFNELKKYFYYNDKNYRKIVTGRGFVLNNMENLHIFNNNIFLADQNLNILFILDQKIAKGENVSQDFYNVILKEAYNFVGICCNAADNILAIFKK